MKLHCNKCNTQLTTDIYTTKTLQNIYGKPWWYDEEEDGVMDNELIGIQLHKGTFIKVKGKIWNNKWGKGCGYKHNHLVVIHDVPLYQVSKEDTLNVPEFKEGYGCCDYSWTDLKCPCCKEIVGEMNYDCHQDFKRTDFLQHKTHFEN